MENTEKKNYEVLNELAIPINVIWDKILFVPLIGTLDTSRGQNLLESMLNKILATESKIIILDILGVETVDTSVAQHLVNITKASKLLGCETIISGISPNIAQAIVSLGIDLGQVFTTSTLKNAFELALDQISMEIIQK